MLTNFSIKRSNLAVFAFIWTLCFATQPAAQGGGLVPFKASYTLTADVVFNLPLATVTSHGSGVASHLGAFTQNSISETANLATGQAEAVQEFTAANGDKITISYHFQLAPTATGFDIAGVWEITGGTGRFTGAIGSGTYAGTAAFTSATTVLATFDMKGTISSVGSLK